MSTSYLYDTADRLEERKPYSYARVGGRDHLAAHAEARSQTQARLDADEQIVDSLVPAARFRMDDAATERAESALVALHERWEGDSAPDTRPLTEVLDGLIESLQGAPGALLRQSASARWARASLQTLLSRFESYGCIHEEYDQRWRRIRSRPNPPEAVVRLALLGSWSAWVSLPLDRAASLAALNVTMKLLDLASSGVRHHHWSLDSRDRARLTAATRIEGVLIESWRSRASGGVLT